MKDIYGYGEKMARNGGKMVIYESQILRLTLYYFSYDVCASKMDQIRKFAEQTSRILEFKPKGLDF